MIFKVIHFNHTYLVFKDNPQKVNYLYFNKLSETTTCVTVITINVLN